MGPYSLHGLSIALSVEDDEIAAALSARLRLLAERATVSELRFEAYRVADGGVGVSRPGGPSRPVYDPPLGEVVHFPESDQLYIEYGGRIQAHCDPNEGTARVSLVGAAPGDAWLVSHPLFTLPLVEMLKRRGLYHVHAAGVSLGERALLLAGPSGSGKSTLTLALVRAGFRFLGDDTLFLRSDGQDPVVLAFPDEVDVSEDSARFFPELELWREAPRPGWAKRQIAVEKAYETEIAWKCRPGAVVLPRIGREARASVLTPISRSEALLALVPNILLTEPRSSQAHLDALGDLVGASECFRLEVGPTLDDVPELLRTIA